MKVLRVDTSKKQVSSEDVPEVYEGLGGRGLTSIMINDWVPADCDPLGPDNRLIFAPGLLSGTALICTSRLSIGAKSPHTGGIKESNIGGTVAAALARMGIGAIVVEGQSSDEKLWILKIDAADEAELLEAGETKGLRTYAFVEKMKAVHGEDYSITCIGPAGERKMGLASVQTTNLDGRPCRAAGRGGLGAVMGAKGLKAIMVARKAKGGPPVADPGALKEAAKAFAKAVKEDEFTIETLSELGTAALMSTVNAAGALPTCNARYGQFEHVDKISGEAMAELIKARGGKTTHKGCSQCIINCSNEFVDKGGGFVTSSLEYETIWSMGAMIGVADLDVVAQLDRLCDEIGVDTVGTGVAMAVAMDAGHKKFGDGPGAIEMVEEIGTGTELGMILGDGAVAVGKHFNHDRVPVSKGQSIAAYDPRAIQGMAVTYATSPMGADHTAGWVVDQNLEAFGGTMDPLSADGQVEASRDAQIHMAAIDTVGLCDFAGAGGMTAEDGLQNLCKVVGARLGKAFSEDDWQALGVRVLRAEREFNRRAGFTNKDDRLSPMFYREPLPPHNKVVLISDEDMDTTFDF